MRHSVLRKLLIASATCLLSLSVMSTPALAQKPRPKPPAGAAKKPPAKPTGGGGGSDAIELDEPAAPAPGKTAPAAPSGVGYRLRSNRGLRNRRMTRR